MFSESSHLSPSKPCPKAAGPYSQVVEANGFFFLAGQIPVDPTTGKLVSSNILTQTNQVLDNIEALLYSVGCSWQHVVRTDVFMQDLEEFAAMNQEYAKRFNTGTLPVRQTIQVARLPLDALIEISCIAYKGK